VLFYCRSNQVTTWTSQTSAGVAVDAVYLHEKFSPGMNKVQDVYSMIEERVDKQASLSGHSAYIFETNSSNVRKLQTLVVTLLAHPKTRQPQPQLPPVPPDLATMAPMSTGATTLLRPPDGRSNNAGRPSHDTCHAASGPAANTTTDSAVASVVHTNTVTTPFSSGGHSSAQVTNISGRPSAPSGPEAPGGAPDNTQTQRRLSAAGSAPSTEGPMINVVVTDYAPGGPKGQ